MIVPRLMASSIGKRVSPGIYQGRVRAEEVREGRTDPTILDGLFPALAVLADTNDNVEAVVTSIQTLAMALRAVADEGEGVVLEVVVKLGKRPVAALVDDLLGACKVEGLYPTRTQSLCGTSQLKKTNGVYFKKFTWTETAGREGAEERARSEYDAALRLVVGRGARRARTRREREERRDAIEAIVEVTQT